MPSGVLFCSRNLLENLSFVGKSNHKLKWTLFSYFKISSYVTNLFSKVVFKIWLIPVIPKVLFNFWFFKS